MDRTLFVGVVVTVLGVAGYAVGVVEPYPGRAFSLSGVMAGLTLVAVATGGSSPSLEEDEEEDGTRGGDRA